MGNNEQLQRTEFPYYQCSCQAGEVQDITPSDLVMTVGSDFLGEYV
jgi:hypothetical protein